MNHRIFSYFFSLILSSGGLTLSLFADSPKTGDSISRRYARSDEIGPKFQKAGAEKRMGMGTNWRSKDFHDHYWQNLGDAGLPDRIAWLKAAARKYPWLDLSRVGIYGGSAGGQSALSALLHHGEFYKAAVSDCGSHDNRMDKIWWNEAWMGKIGPHYEKNSNVFHANTLEGALMLTVGELDKNVDPASTLQVVDALVRAGKDFEFYSIPGAGH